MWSKEGMSWNFATKCDRFLLLKQFLSVFGSRHSSFMPKSLWFVGDDTYSTEYLCKWHCNIYLDCWIVMIRAVTYAYCKIAVQFRRFLLALEMVKDGPVALTTIALVFKCHCITNTTHVTNYVRFGFVRFLQVMSRYGAS